jgi:hypothetical protein
LVDVFSSRADTAVTRPFIAATDSKYPFGFSSSENFPWVFGQINNMRLLPWRFGPIGELAEDVSPLQKTIKLVNSQGFPTSGSIQISSEKVGYSTNLFSLNQLGSNTYPLDREVGRWHNAGEPVYLIPHEGFAWFVADHDVESVGNFQDALSNELIFTPTKELLDIRGREATVVESALLPVTDRLQLFRETFPLDESYGFEWFPGGFNTATDPVNAVDYLNPDSFAEIDIARRVLELRHEPLINSNTLFGEATNVKVNLIYSSNIRWAADSTLTLRLSSGSRVTFLDIDPPAGGGPIQTRKVSWTITSFFGADWLFFNKSPILYLGFNPVPGDQAEIQIHGLWIEVTSVSEQAGRPVTEVFADVNGWKGSGDVVMDNPAQLLMAMIEEEDALNIQADLWDANTAPPLVEQFDNKGVTVSRLVREKKTWADLIRDLLMESGLQIIPQGDKWSIVEQPVNCYHSSSVAPVEDRELVQSALLKDQIQVTQGVGMCVLLYGEAQGRQRAFTQQDVLGSSFENRFDDKNVSHWLGQEQGAAARLMHSRQRSCLQQSHQTVNTQWLPWRWMLADVSMPSLLNQNNSSSLVLARPISINNLDKFNNIEATWEVYFGGKTVITFDEVGEEVARIVLWQGVELGVFINNTLVAVLPKEYDLMLKGSVRIVNNIGNSSEEDAVQWDSSNDRLVFYASDDEDNIGRFAIDSEGNFHVVGELLTNQSTMLIGGAQVVEKIGKTVRLGFLDGSTIVQGQNIGDTVLIKNGIRENIL